jgi:cyclopropane fatty-acyl-phospholipid synthase-like methyltransferase
MISDRGYWTGEEDICQHSFDTTLAQRLLLFFEEEKPLTIVDLGCGLGDYVKFFCDSGLACDGFDGNPNTPELTEGKCKVLDLSTPIRFKERYDWVLSLEVGEHLPKKYEDIFIKNLHHNNKCGVVLSWATKGQTGHGHFNEQGNKYIKNRFSELGYINDIGCENQLRRCASLPWFKNTIMVFRKIML